MANFDVQIQALAGTATQTEMDDWMNDGVKRNLLFKTNFYFNRS